MVSTKPPCEVAIDGVATVLTTPHKFELAAGKHTITLFDVGRHIKATIPVVIAPRKTTKLVRDFLAESAP